MSNYKLHLFVLLHFFQHGHSLDVNGVARSLAENSLKGFVSGNGTAVELLAGLNQIKNSTIPPTIRLSLRESENDIEEIDCLESMFMSPFHDPVSFAVNDSIGQRQDRTCKWNFFGTEPCIPMLSCESFNLLPPDSSGICQDEYLEVFDGYKGLSRYCGNVGPMKVSAANDLRDLFILFKTIKSSKAGTDLKFKCTVVCSNRGDGTGLPMVFKEKINPKCSCGTKINDDRIVGGVDAAPNEFPWLVALVEAKTRQPFCGGSIINDRMIITAGHCFKGRYLDIRNIEILVSAHRLDVTPNTLIMSTKPLPHYYDAEVLKELDMGNGSIRYKPDEVFVHPLYVSETNDFDVAVIHLSTPIDFLAKNKTVRPICLPELGSYLRTFGGKKATVAGWGLQGLQVNGTPEVLQKVDVKVFPPKECKSVYAHRVNRRMMCAGYLSGGLDSCAGDSGGPLVLEDKDKVWYQIGSVSWGDGCAREGSPGVYFRTTESEQWAHYNSNVNDAVWCRLPRV